MNIESDWVSPSLLAHMSDNTSRDSHFNCFAVHLSITNITATASSWVKYDGHAWDHVKLLCATASETTKQAVWVALHLLHGIKSSTAYLANSLNSTAALAWENKASSLSITACIPSSLSSTSRIPPREVSVRNRAGKTVWTALLALYTHMRSNVLTSVTERGDKVKQQNAVKI